MTMWRPDISNHQTALYQAIADVIESDVEAGTLKSGDKLPTHRALAEQLGVTVGTVTRGYAEAEKRGSVTARVGSGTFVTPARGEVKGLAILAREHRGKIDFSLNLPIPVDTDEQLQAALGKVAKEVPHLDLVGYQPEKGALWQREWASNWFQKQGVDCDAENITITCGGQHAITLALAATVRPGEHLLCEGLTYPGLNATASQMGIKVTGLPQDEHGLLPEALEEYCKAGRFRALYCIPVAQNPTNSKMTLERKHKILEIAERYHLWIIEDAISAFYCKDETPSFYQLNPERSLHINGHSKMLAGGLRVGYLLSPAKLSLQVSEAIRSHCWFTSPMTVEIAHRWIADDGFESSQLNIKEQLDKRLQAAAEILADFNCNILAGSFHIWLHLPEPWRASDFVARMSEKGVSVLSSEPFAVGRFEAPQAIRICISGPVTLEAVVKGLEIIRDELKSGLSHHLRVF